jgi:hypothetical protein
MPKHGNLGALLSRTHLRLIIAVALLCPNWLFAQERMVDHNAHGWYSYFGDHPFGGSKWGVHLEEQYRRHDVVRQWQQLLLRPGLNYQAKRNLMLTLGYAYARSFSYSEFAPLPKPTNEHRIWEQALFRYSTGRVAWATRLRFENRFLGSAVPGTGFRYENRFRSLQQATIQLRKPLYLTGYNEFWVFVKPYVSNSAFDQNRAYAALGFNLRPTWRLEVGYMNQALLHRSGSVLESNHTLMLSLYSTARIGSADRH